MCGTARSLVWQLGDACWAQEPASNACSQRAQTAFSRFQASANKGHLVPAGLRTGAYIEPRLAVPYEVRAVALLEPRANRRFRVQLLTVCLLQTVPLTAQF